MALTTDIAQSYRAPRRVVRRHLAAGPREDRALMFLMVGCLLIFVAQLPRLSRQATLEGEAALGPLAAAELFVWLFFAPLFFYALAGLVAWGMRLAGSAIGWYEARLALFWTVLATTPLWLLRGLVSGFIGPGPGLDAVSLLALGIFGVLWFAGLREAGAQSVAATPRAP